MRNEIEGVLASRGLHGFTAKMLVGGQDVYLKVALHKTSGGDAALVHVDVTLSSSKVGIDILQTHCQTTLEATKTDNARAMVEMLCRQADVLLQSGVWTWESLCAAWEGTRFEPDGLCSFPASRFSAERKSCFVSSPLDAAARFIRQSFPEWKRCVEERWSG